MKQVYYFLVTLITCSFPLIYSLDDYDGNIDSLHPSNLERVDKDVKRPVRFCQGFEDPEEVDCYMRSDVKPYVCTEPVTFNPCESQVRVETYHYDHIIHRCLKVSVPACEGQLIRALTLLQCLIYCHHRDPFALGKSKSMVYKLNQPKPYVPQERIEDERKKVIKMDFEQETIVQSTSDDIARPISKLAEKLHETEIVGLMEDDTAGGEAFSKKIKSDEQLADYIVNGNTNSLKTPSVEQPINKTDVATTIPTPQSVNKTNINTQKDDESLMDETSENDKKEMPNDINRKKAEDTKKSQIVQSPIAIKNGETDKKVKTVVKIDKKVLNKIFNSQINKIQKKANKIVKNKKMMNADLEKKLNDIIHSTDSIDKSRDDGFYVWDE